MTLKKPDDGPAYSSDVLAAIELEELRPKHVVHKAPPGYHPLEASKHVVSRSLVHVCLGLAVAQMFLGAGNVFAKLGLAGETNPVLFACIRESVAAPLLCALAYWMEGPALPSGKRHFLMFVCLGAALFGNHGFFIIGLKASNATTASAWQPSQPIITTVLALLLGYEKRSLFKAMGISLACSGALFMVLAPGLDQLSGNMFGHTCFLLNCSCASCFILLSKKALAAYPHLWVTGWSYLCAAFFMACAAALVASVPSLLDAVCAECDGNPWVVPAEATWALLYLILFSTMFAYSLITWGNKQAPASMVSAFSVLQPLTTAALSSVLLLFGVSGLEHPGIQDLGGLAILGGLALLLFEQVRDSPKAKHDHTDTQDMREMQAIHDEEATCALSADSRSANQDADDDACSSVAESPELGLAGVWQREVGTADNSKDMVKDKATHVQAHTLSSNIKTRTPSLSDSK